MLKRYWLSNKGKCLIVVLFLIYLFNANQIVARWANREHQIKKADIQNLRETEEVYYGIDAFNIQNDFFDKIYISGWAFCESSPTEFQNSINIILKGEKGTQRVKTDVSSRRDVYDLFKNLNIDISNPEVGFAVSFSTVGLKADNYDVFIECSTAEKPLGIGETGIKLLKTAGGILQVYPTGDIFFDDTILTDKVRFEIDLIECTNEQLKISGWGIVENKISAELLYYIKIITDNKEKIYPLVKTPRKDISGAYGNDIYLLSGFSLDIRCSDEIIRNGTTIQLIVETPEKEYLASSLVKEVILNSDGGYFIK